MKADHTALLAPLRFGELVLDEPGFALRRKGKPVAIEPRALKVLLHLARNRQRAVPRAELAALLWPDRVVSETSLKEAINLARRAVGDDADAQTVVATLRGHGYRFVAEVDEMERVLATSEPTAFVGRVRELESLHAIASEVGRGTARVVLLEGEAGIGKTALVRRFAEMATTAGFAVVRGRSESECGAPSYWTWIQVLRQLLAHPEMLGATRRTSPRLDIVRQLVGSAVISEQADVAANGHRFRLFDEVAELLRHFASARPLLIVLDDLQSANEDSLLLLRFLARSLETTRTMLVGTFRRAAVSDSPSLMATLSELRRVPWFAEMTIGGLSETETIAMIGRTVSAREARDLRRRTGGNPLFLKETLRHAASRLTHDQLATAHHASLPQRDLAPPGVRDLVAQRVGRLDLRTRAIFDAAAVLGERFDLADVAHLVGRRTEAIADDVEALQAEGLFQPAGHLGERQFMHPIVREAALTLLAPRHARRLHAKAAKRIESRDGAERVRRLTRLAYHSFAALPSGSIDKAVRYGQAAAAQAASGFAYEDAAQLYRETLAVAARRSRPSSRERCELLVALGEVSSRTANQPAARAAALEAFRLGVRHRRGDLCARAACALGPTLLPLQPGTVDEERVALLEQALALIRSPDKARRIRVYGELAVALYWSPDSRRCLAAAETAVEIARKLGRPAPLAHALYARMIARWRPSAGRADSAAVREAIRVADDADEGDLAMAGAVRLGHVLAEAGDLDALDRLTANLKQRAERLGYPQARLWPLIFQAARFIRQRRFDGAQEAIDRVRATAIEAWEPGGEPYCAFLLALLRLEQGTFEGLVEVFDRLAIWVPDLPVAAPLPLILAGVGEADRGLDAYRRLVARRPWETSDHMGTIASLTLLAACAARFEDRDTANGIYDVLAPHAGEYAVVASVAGILSPLTHTLGELCGTLGRYEQAVAHFERAVQECRAAGLESDAVRTELAWARVLARRGKSGDRRRARALGRQAQRRAEALAMPVLVADAALFNATWPAGA